MSHGNVGRSAPGIHPKSGSKPTTHAEVAKAEQQFSVDARASKLRLARFSAVVSGFSVMVAVVVVALLATPLNISHFTKLFAYLGSFAGESAWAEYSNYAAAVLMVLLGLMAGAGIMLASGWLRAVSLAVAVASLAVSFLATGVSLQGTTQSAMDGAARNSRAASIADAGLSASQARIAAAQQSLQTANQSLAAAQAQMTTGAEMGEFNRRQKPAYDAAIASAQQEMQAAQDAHQRALSAAQSATENVGEGPQAVFATLAKYLFGDKVDGDKLAFYINMGISALITLSPTFVGMFAGTQYDKHTERLEAAETAYEQSGQGGAQSASSAPERAHRGHSDEPQLIRGEFDRDRRARPSRTMAASAAHEAVIQSPEHDNTPKHSRDAKAQAQLAKVIAGVHSGDCAKLGVHSVAKYANCGPDRAQWIRAELVKQGVATRQSNGRLKALSA